ncbi:MAG: SpoIIE family protein phosphatase [Planctomycetota bacterium]
MSELIIRLPDGRTFKHVLTGEPQVIGRDATCDIFVDDPSASRRHARLRKVPGGYVVEDLGSKNGTLVNDSPSASQVLKSGDHLLIGSVTAIFSDAPALSSPSVVVEDDTQASLATRYVTSNKRLLLSQRRLEMIYELSERLTTLQHRDRLLEGALDICFETLQFERGAVGVRRPNQRTVEWPVVRNLRGVEGELTISRTLLNRALEHGERATFTAGGSSSSDPTVSIVQHGIRSAMCVPLIHGEQVLGVIYGDRTTSSTVYAQEDVDFLAAIAHQVTIGLVNCQLLDEQRQMIRLQHDLDLARKIQTGLFPSRLPSREGLQVAALNDPGQRISGDYYDVVEVGDNRFWCIMADVTGEGVSAALLMANLQAAVRVTIESATDPGDLLTQWNRLICRNTDASKFVTCLCALIDLPTHTIRFSSAGHLPPWLVSMGALDPEELLVSEAGFPLGIEADVVYPSRCVELNHGPFLFFTYTDGVIEAMDADGRHFGRDRLKSLLAQHREVPPAALIRHVRREVSQYVGPAPQSDDITMLAVRVG